MPFWPLVVELAITLFPNTRVALRTSDSTVRCLHQGGSLLSRLSRSIKTHFQHQAGSQGQVSFYFFFFCVFPLPAVNML